MIERPSASDMLESNWNRAVIFKIHTLPERGVPVGA